ncbi:hypothetical protein MIND_00734200 [Mycena indigotica]|uniref:DUF1682-domain-containing protein n=1 Tax=Mycena indigotica TaxID=2126181 RepID=A0A8H6SMS3_9AGAR|nr:uncharacterized protein MIND_00734200 [Mycena indigotica]KAF7301687.1 hypothetical protein MIND_00734200 [Mycena indigotica]
MASVLTQFLTALTPPPVYVPESYDGVEFRWRIFTFRPALFQMEAYLLSGLLVYVGFFFFGRFTNSRNANKWVDAHQRILESQFSSPLKFVQDGYSDFFNFSTGRRNVATLHTIFTLRPRHDLVQWIWQTGRQFVDLQYRPKDDLQLDFKLIDGVLPYDFVWGVVSKEELLFVKESRWDLTFTKTTENQSLPNNYLVMSEFADVTESILKASPLVKILADPKITPYFRSLTITDQPRERPAQPLLPNEHEKHVILSLNVPSPSQASVTNDLVSAIFQFVDSLTKVTLRPETKIKLKKVREEVDADIKREAERDKKEEEAEALEAKKAAKRRAEEERIAKLPAAEQQKILEREKRRSIRKQQVKVRK